MTPAAIIGFILGACIGLCNLLLQRLMKLKSTDNSDIWFTRTQVIRNPRNRTLEAEAITRAFEEIRRYRQLQPILNQARYAHEYVPVRTLTELWQRIHEEHDQPKPELTRINWLREGF